MLKKIAVSFAAVLACASTSSAQLTPETLTLFHHADRAWGVGTLHLSKPLTFREGKILAFPSQFTDLVWAPNNTKPRNMMLVLEVWPEDKDKPFFQDKDDIFAPIKLLPQNSYWKDNLPATPRHAVAGGRRYVFRGDQIPEAKKVLTEWFKARESESRRKDQLVVVAGALLSPVQVIREDAVTWFEVNPQLANDYDDRALPSIKAYLASPAPAEEKAKLLAAFSKAKIDAVKNLLPELAEKDDAAGAAAMQALLAFGEKPSTESLLAKSRSFSPEVRTVAMDELCSRAATEDAAFAQCKEITDDVRTPARVMNAALAGLGRAQSERVRAVLVSTVERGDNGARPAAAALASWGPSSEADLTRILKESQGEPAIAAAAGLLVLPRCGGCRKTLEDQHDSHPDHQVRDMIGVLTGVPLVHKH